MIRSILAFFGLKIVYVTEVATYDYRYEAPPWAKMKIVINNSKS